MNKKKNREMVITYNKMNIFLPEESMIKGINPEKRKSGVSFLSLCTWGDLAEAQNRIKGFSASCEILLTTSCLRSTSTQTTPWHLLSHSRRVSDAPAAVTGTRGKDDITPSFGSSGLGRWSKHPQIAWVLFSPFSTHFYTERWSMWGFFLNRF